MTAGGRSPAPSGVALLLGAEGPGLSDEALALADHRVRIPMAGGVDSLNVATAAAVAFHAVGRARYRVGLVTVSRSRAGGGGRWSVVSRSGADGGAVVELGCLRARPGDLPRGPRRAAARSGRGPADLAAPRSGGAPLARHGSGPA